MKHKRTEEINKYESFEKSILLRKHGDIGNRDFNELYKVIENLSPEYRQTRTKSSCEIFLNQVKKYRYNKENIDESFINVIKDLIKIIEVATEREHDNSGEAFFSFLTRLLELSPALKKNNREAIIQQLLDEYNLFQDFISEVSWLFELIDGEGNFVFPISELLIFAINEFELDSKHLLLLAISLQLFCNMKEIKKKKERKEISQKVLEIVKNNHIEILQCIYEGGELIYDISNYVYNKVIAVKNNNKIVIRSTNKSYFSSEENGRIKCEINNNNNETAYYIINNILPYEHYCSFSDFMVESSSAEIVKFLIKVLEGKYFNIFQGKSIVMNCNNKEFIKFANQCSNCDEFIIYDNIIKECNYENFFQIISKKIENVRPLILKGNNCDLVTFDFIIQFYLEIVKESNAKYIECLKLDCDKNDFYQNEIIKSYFDDIIENRSYNYVEEKLECYYQFIKRYFFYNDIRPNMRLNNNHKLIIPYFFQIPFNGEEEQYYHYMKRLLFNQEGDKLKLGNLEVKASLWEHSYQVNGLDVSEWKFLEIDRQAMEEKPTRNIKVLVDDENKFIYSLEQLKRTVTKLRQCQEIRKESVLTYEFIQSYNQYEIEEICRLINNIGLADCNYNIFGCDVKNNYSLRKSIIMYKLLWHFQMMRFDVQKVQKFSQLVLKLHYTKSATDDDEIKRYFKSVEEDMKKPGHLIIAKETSSNDGTLLGMYNRIRNAANRSLIMNAFEVNGLRDIKKDKDTGKYLLHGQEIKKICILTDLITKGSATIEMLNYYLNNEKKDGSPKKFLQLNIDGENGIYNIINTNNPIISVKAMFAYKNGIEAIKSKIENNSIGGRESAIGVVGHTENRNKIQENDIKFNHEIKIETVNEIPNNRYIINQKVCEIVKELYGKDEKRHGLCCVFRYVNMPRVTVFPNDTAKTEYIAGLFNRRGEVG